MKKATNKPAGKQKVSGGKAKMHTFSGAGKQKPGISGQTQNRGKGASFAKGGGSGKMHRFTPTKTQSSGVTGPRGK